MTGPLLQFLGCDPARGAWRGSVLLLLPPAQGAVLAAQPTMAVLDEGARSPLLRSPPAVPTSALLAGEACSHAGAAPARAGRTANVQPERLDEYGGWVFWRFELLLGMGAAERRVQYAFHANGVDPERRCAPGPAPLARPRLPPARDAPDRPRRWAFVVPGREQRWRWAYYSCNGMDQDADVKKFGKPHLWADLLRRHDAAPLHALVGGGDQLYNDGLWRSPSLGPWLGGDGLHPGTVYNSEVRGWRPAGPEGVG